MGWNTFPEGLDTVDRIRDSYANPLKFGIKFLDDALGGIFPDDLIIPTARTGGGKTELVTQIALTNAQAGKKIYYFALEAHPGEIESRITFKLLSQAFFTQFDWKKYKETPNYQAWLHRKQDHLLKKFEPEVKAELRRTLMGLNIFYREKNFVADTFESNMARMGASADLVIVDHLHYFDFDSTNENLDLKRTVKQIKDITSFYRKPTILVVQLRKSDPRYQSPIPSLEDIHGSSDIAKIATKIIATAQVRTQLSCLEKTPGLFATYFGVLKNRTDGSRCAYTALCNFDTRQNTYSPQYMLGNPTKDNLDFEEIPAVDYPMWARDQDA